MKVQMSVLAADSLTITFFIPRRESIYTLKFVPQRA
jgi:hypothetical protein